MKVGASVSEVECGQIAVLGASSRSCPLRGPNRLDALAALMAAAYRRPTPSPVSEGSGLQGHSWQVRTVPPQILRAALQSGRRAVVRLVQAVRVALAVPVARVVPAGVAAIATTEIVNRV